MEVKVTVRNQQTQDEKHKDQEVFVRTQRSIKEHYEYNIIYNSQGQTNLMTRTLAHIPIPNKKK